MKKLMIAFGTRPEWLKVKPLIEEFMRHGEMPVLLYVGQHEYIDFGQLHPQIIKVHHGPNRLDAILYSVISTGLWEQNKDVTHVLVQGDTTTAMAVALSAFHHKKAVIHMEAGLRTYDNDNPWPEEANRRIISQVASIHLCPTAVNSCNLELEGVNGDIYVVGNTSIDNLKEYKEHCEYGNTVVVTMHRRENHPLMKEWFTEIDKLAYMNPALQFIIPIHPNPEVKKHASILKHVKVIDPLHHPEMLTLLTQARMVITDSGGIQEECSYFNKLCFVCRKKTERPEAESTVMVRRPQDLHDLFWDNFHNYKLDLPCPYGDGHAAEEIYKILKSKI